MSNDTTGKHFDNAISELELNVARKVINYNTWVTRTHRKYIPSSKKAKGKVKAAVKRAQEIKLGQSLGEQMDEKETRPRQAFSLEGVMERDNEPSGSSEGEKGPRRQETRNSKRLER